MDSLAPRISIMRHDCPGGEEVGASAPPEPLTSDLLLGELLLLGSKPFHRRNKVSRLALRKYSLVHSTNSHDTGIN